ncbi:GNAT family N-acetyltransferase [Crystallibacter degradans]|uniref:GNAT family N-acetyltransferase n=1 Tax=Crystallibacter degradans TaxID=2726743 RepID=UPI0014729BBD|nr:N-acetyltransferase [Arthrobacter sp. SF27]NMR28750.1 N-acetyltransferase [Arthrobacter sp. SF27]
MPAVRDDPTHSQFIIFSDGTVAGTLTYRIKGAEIWFLKTTIDRGFRNKQLDTFLIISALDFVHRRQLMVRPMDPLVKKTMYEHPEYLHLLPHRPHPPVRRGRHPVVNQTARHPVA